MTRKAYCQIRDQPVYRRGAFLSGLHASGFDNQPMHTLGPGRPGDVLVTWNRYGGVHEQAVRFEREGGLVLVAENAYVGNDRSDRTRYALARHRHNGAGEWYSGGPERWRDLGIELKPWRRNGEHVLVCPNRSFGTPGYMMPSMWPEQIVEQLRKHTKRPIRLRPHPGNDPPKRPLAEDLRNAWMVVIWASSAGCEALMEGIPVVCCAPAWVCKEAAGSVLHNDDFCAMPDRLPVFERLAWAQWHVEEIARGAPFQHLCY